MPAWVVRATCAGAFLLLCAFAYAPLAAVGLTGPDLRALADTSTVLEARNLGELARGLHQVRGLEGHALPAVSLLVSTVLWSDGGVWSQAAAWPLRLENLLLLLVASVGLGAFLRRLLLPWLGSEQARAAGLAAMLLTALAPTAVASVVRVPARGDLLALALGCWAGLLLMRGRQERKPLLGVLAGLLALLAGLSSDLALALPFVLAAGEFASARRWRRERTRWRTALTTLVAFGACVGLQIAVRAALTGRVEVFTAGSRLGRMHDFSSVLEDQARSLERLGVLLLPVHVDVIGVVGYALAGGALLVALHPALLAARSAPRLWGWLAFAWLAFVGRSELFSPGVRVGPGDLTRADALTGTALIGAAGVAICATALSGPRRVVLPWLVACSWALLGHGASIAWRDATREVTWLRADLEDARETYGREALVIVIDPPGAVHGVDALQGELGALLEPPQKSSREGSAREPVRGATLEAFLALAREAELDELRREPTLVSFPRAAVGADGEGRLAVLLDAPRPSGGTRSWQQTGRSPSDLDLEAMDERMLRVRATPEADTVHAPVAHWRAEAALDRLREGELAGVWRSRGPESETPVAVFDLSSSLAWVLAGRVRQIYPREGWGRIEEAEVLARLPSRPPPAGGEALLPDVVQGDWRFEPPENGFARDPEGRDSWAVELLDLATWRHVELAARLDGAGGLVVPDAARTVADWLRDGGTSVAWSLEGRLDGVAVWRAHGRRVAAGER